MTGITLHKSVLYSFIQMFIVCPVSLSLEDANWYENLEDAKDDALDWSVELSGENVGVYEAIEENGGYTFNRLSLIFA